ncbi:MAG: cytochrome-c peroxidase [Bacteroidales bacterium]|nr:cytochrome-c peroxidase [Bacteroidales bacterium]
MNACNENDEIELVPVNKTTPYEIKIPFGFPTILNIPEDNPMTVEGIELGRYLFYDGRISGNSDPEKQMSCATCHLQENAFECGIDHPKYTEGKTFGVTGIPTPHYMLPLFNQVWNHNGYLWNGSVDEDNPDRLLINIKALTYMSIIAPHEMNSDTASAVAAIGAVSGYAELFKKAFGSEEVTIDRMSKAIAQFIRTFISANSRFDQYLRGETQLMPSELNGYVLFVTEEGADCFHCHGGSGNPMFTTHLYYNNAKDSIFDDPRDRFSINGDPMMRGAYKAPSLRNIALTAPYMHDGRFKTLDEVIDFYSSGLVNSPYVDPLMHYILYGGTGLTVSEKADLKAFLLALTDEEFIKNPALSKPDLMP